MVPIPTVPFKGLNKPINFITHKNSNNIIMPAVLNL